MRRSKLCAGRGPCDLGGTYIDAPRKNFRVLLIISLASAFSLSLGVLARHAAIGLVVGLGGMCLKADTALMFEAVVKVSSGLVDCAGALAELLADLVALPVVGVNPVHED